MSVESPDQNLMKIIVNKVIGKPEIENHEVCLVVLLVQVSPEFRSKQVYRMKESIFISFPEI